MPGVSTELESFSSSASHQTGVSASTELQGKHVRNGWITGDQPLRKCLVVFGMFSGLPTGIRIKSLRHLITLYHFSMTCFVTANFILVLYWLAKHITISNITEPGMFRNLIVTIWRAQVTGCDWVIFVLCHTEAGYNSYYSHIQTMTEDNKSGTRIPDSGQIYRHLQRVVVAIGTLLTIFQQALSINSYMHMEKGSWTPENIFTAVVLVIMQIHWAFQTAFIVSILMTNWQMFAAFNSKLECDASDNPGNVRQNLHKYRRSHRRLSELVKKANSCLRHLIAITLGIAMVIELMTLFLIVHGSNLSTGTIVAAWFYALTIGCGVFALVLFAAKVSDAVSYSCQSCFNRLTA